MVEQANATSSREATLAVNRARNDVLIGLSGTRKEQAVIDSVITGAEDTLLLA
jgi:hypothetical protein